MKKKILLLMGILTVLLSISVIYVQAETLAQKCHSFCRSADTWNEYKYCVLGCLHGGTK
jgi:hypothetical protein